MDANTDAKSGFENFHLETTKSGGVVVENLAYTDKEVRRVRRRLDIWLMPILMTSYALQ